jgi:hypothetical protein
MVVGAILGLFAMATQMGVLPITDPEEFNVCPPNSASGESGESPDLPKASAHDGPVEFWNDVYPILEKSCLPCHGPKRQYGEFRVDRREGFFETRGRPALVIPGNSSQSPLIDIVSGRRKDIPKTEVHQLSSKEVAFLKAWIDAGAP